MVHEWGFTIDHEGRLVNVNVVSLCISDSLLAIKVVVDPIGSIVLDEELRDLFEEAKDKLVLSF